MAGNGAIPAIAAYVPIKPGWQIKKSMARIVMEENRKVHNLDEKNLKSLSL